MGEGEAMTASTAKTPSFRITTKPHESIGEVIVTYGPFMLNSILLIRRGAKWSPHRGEPMAWERVEELYHDGIWSEVSR